MLKTKASLVLTLVFLPIYVSAAICENRETFTKEVDGVPRYCKWFRFKEFRRQEHCTDQKVRDNCPQACGLCCDDDPNYEFVLPNTLKTVNCAWITLNPNKESTRKKIFCQPEMAQAGRTIRDACPDSCNFCFANITEFPTVAPSISIKPSMVPTSKPTLSLVPSPSPSLAPSISAAPTEIPFTSPSDRPSSSPTRPPSPMPSPFPTLRPTLPVPSQKPSSVPSVPPSQRPTAVPTLSLVPSPIPSKIPSCSPSNSPSHKPTSSPSVEPSKVPSTSPSDEPTLNPSETPTDRPSDTPSEFPSISVFPSTLPSVSPTVLPTNVPSKSPTDLPTKTPTTSPTIHCHDKKLFKFNLDDSGKEVSCGWISANFYKREIRRAKYCNRLKIKLACKEACDKCWCLDDPDYKFETKIANRIVDCAWISQSEINWQTRVGTYCGTRNNPTEVANHCTRSCKYCSPEASDSPSISPSLSRSPSHKPTAFPSVSPTATPTDRPTNSKKPSVSPTAHPTSTVMPSNLPSSEPSSNPTKSIKPSALPTAKPSGAPSESAKPSSKPSSIPTYSSKPSRTPTAIPTSSPSTDEPTYHPTITCLDDHSFTFTLDNGIVRDCSWITGNSQNTPIRIAAYCPKAHIKSACKATCQFCTCKNNISFKFEISTGEMKHCKFITFNPFKIEQRRESQCGTVTNPSEVANNCPFDCGFCFKPE